MRTSYWGLASSSLLPQYPAVGETDTSLLFHDKRKTLALIPLTFGLSYGFECLCRRKVDALNLPEDDMSSTACPPALWFEEKEEHGAQLVYSDPVRAVPCAAMYWIDRN